MGAHARITGWRLDRNVLYSAGRYSEKWTCIFCAHPNIKAAYTRKIGSLKEAADENAYIRLELKNTERLEIGRYQIWWEKDWIYVDQSRVIRNHTKDCRTRLQTPEIREGNRLEIYVEPNLIEIYINDGEYVLSKVVYDMGKEYRAECGSGIEIFTIEK